MKVLLIGAAGQLGVDVARAFQGCHVHRADMAGAPITLDITDHDAVRAPVSDLAPDCVMNTSAGNPRNPRRPAHDSATDSSWSLCCHGRHFRGRRSRTALHDAARQERNPASSDQVAIDADAAHMMGFDPLSDCRHIRLAHELGLGCGDPREIELVGEAEIASKSWGFMGPFKKMTFASSMQHKIYWGPLKRPIEWSLKTWLAPWAYIASVLYHDWFWYPLPSRRVMQTCLESPWGRLFENRGSVPSTDAGSECVGKDALDFPPRFFSLLSRARESPSHMRCVGTKDSQGRRRP